MKTFKVEGYLIVKHSFTALIDAENEDDAWEKAEVYDYRNINVDDGEWEEEKVETITEITE